MNMISVQIRYTLTTDTVMLLLTVLKNGEKVYDEVRYEDLCPDG